ncbi:putative signal transducing protein [Planctomyces sp. SH-PL14]|uniref:putative signal transducing protein n=1 Tax=Planctomyces sp. SH-PL14 TaxID=1632864 RepID=UPI00078B3798|nr:DUF2007 domain-containing protein [Planctomyces sp. SH-PL14]AMV21448.1 hypothetical protein VT03_26330 [Planctomyces sp. SH-PL14]
MNELDRLECVREFHNEVEAASAQALLEQSGIASTLLGGQIRTTLSYVGTAVEYVKLMVAQEDAAAARDLLAREEQEASDRAVRTAWTCPRCGSDVDAGFDVCWNCGNSGDVPSEGTPADTPDSADQTTGTKAPSELTEDDKIRRLLRGAILNLACAPLLFITVPLVLSIDKPKLSPRGLRRYWVAIVLLVATTFVWGAFIASFFIPTHF